MKYIESKLSRQLLSIIIIIFCLVFLTLGFLLPKALLPVYENNLYNYLRQPLNLIEEDIENSLLDTEVAYLYLYENDVAVSENFQEIAKNLSISELFYKTKEKYGKFIHNGQYYYYYKMETGPIVKIALTNNHYIVAMRKDILDTTLPILFVTFFMVTLILIIWSGRIVRKVERLKAKIDHIDQEEYDHSIIEFKTDDEMKSLAMAIEDMRISLKSQEEYRNQMYQNISHDFKTPLTVIKSYIEAASDGIETKDNALSVIEEQTRKLEQKVHSLLYLNKLDYIKDFKDETLDEIDIRPLIESSTEKFKFYRKELTYLITADKAARFYGSLDLWETIIDNLLSNFMRYAQKEIRITVKKDKIIFWNDGANIDADLLEVLFVPFRKGMKGEFGLGLSIVQKTVNLLGYDIQVKNQKKGVSFIITKGIRK